MDKWLPQKGRAMVLALMTHQHFFGLNLGLEISYGKKTNDMAQGTTPKKTLGHFCPKILELGRKIYKYCVFSLDYPHPVTHQIRVRKRMCFYWTLHFHDSNKVTTLAEEDLLLFQPCGPVWALKW
jgi:hypothetical protein